MVLDLNHYCRLCAKDNGSEIDVYSTSLQKFNLKELISKYFSITVNIDDRTPKKICDDCYDFIKKLVKFNESIEKANQMFLELLSKEDNITTAHSIDIREKYGIFESIKSEFIDESEMFVHLDVMPSKIESSEHVNVSIKTENSDADDTIELDEPQNISSINNDIEEKQSTRKTTKISTNIIQNFSDDNGDNKAIENIKIKKISNKKKLKSTTSTAEKKEYKIKIKKEQKLRIEERSECDICHKTFSSRRVLEGHVKSFHSERQFECEICHKKFGTEKSLKVHGDVHLPYDQRYSCPYCDKKFTKSVNIKPHIRTVHFGEKSFVCEECGKAFGTKGNLMGHMYTHNTEVIYKCSHCDKEFRNKNCLQVHEDTHSNTIYICPQCGLQLKTRKTLTTHMLVHSDEKKYKCEHCGMAFKRSGHLKHHLLSHIGLKPFSCQFCDKAFTNTQNCRMHMSKVHAQEIAGLESIGSGLSKIKSEIPSLDQLKAIAAQAPLSS